MGSVLGDSYHTYVENLRLVVLFSIPFIIAFAIPLLAPLPTYVSAGAIFLRTASIFVNLSAASLAIITIALVISLLFISFAFVAISLIVKSRKTHMRIGRRVLADIERYIGRVFIVLLAYAVILIAANIIGYYMNQEALVTSLVGFILFALIFYAPSAIVVDSRRVLRALGDSARLLFNSPQYFIIWILLFWVVVSAVDLAVILITSGAAWAAYITLVITSVFIIPYFVIFQAEAYMRRFPLLSH